jgi:adenosylhomocysteinase
MDGFSPTERFILAVSDAPNRSLAASCVAAGGGLDAAALRAWGVRQAASGEEADFDPLRPAGIFRGRSAAERIAWARAHMPCVTALAGAYESEGGGIFSGLRIAVNLIVEPKTAVFLLALKQLGAALYVYCGESSVDEAVALELKAAGMNVYAGSGSEDEACALCALDESGPGLILDDGAGLSRLLYMERPGLIGGLFGISEETTSGVTALRAMEREGVLATPAVAVNDTKIKTLFDNLHGTGETVAAALMRLTGESPAGRDVVVAGYGPVGAGLCKRLSALGAQVTVAEVSPVAALRALHDGFRVAPLAAACGTADWILSASGVRHTISPAALLAAKDGAVVASAGGSLEEIACEQAVRELGADFDISDPDLCRLTLGGKTLRVLSSGHGINYTSGGGNPIEIMDLSFAGQFASLAYLIENRGALPPAVLQLPDRISEDIARIKLASKRVEIDDAPPSGEWRRTRFAAAREREAR